jgi:hypothetical protein
MQEQTDKLKKLRLAIIIASIVGLLSFFSMTTTIFPYGNGDTTLLYLLRYPVLFVSTISTIAKVRSGFLLTLLTVLTYSILLTGEAGKYFIFDFHNNVLFWVLLLPYLTFLTLVQLTTTYLTITFHLQKHLN